MALHAFVTQQLAAAVHDHSAPGTAAARHAKLVSLLPAEGA